MSDAEISIRMKPGNTIAGLKKLADELEWALDFLKTKNDSINIAITRANDLHQITLTINTQEQL